MEKRVHLLGPAVALNKVTPCAACKLLRRRCAEECPFSPYFSPHEPHKFLAVHKVFGASNVSKLLLEVPEGQRADAANSLVYEANVRLRDPVYGCMGAIAALQQQLHSLQAQLDAVRSEILKHDIIRSQAAAAAAPSSSAPTVTITTNNSSTITVAAAGADSSNNNISISTHHHHHLIRSPSSGGTLSAVAMLPPSEQPQRPLTPPLHPAASAQSAPSNSSSSSSTSGTAVTISSLYSTQQPNTSSSIGFSTNNNDGYMCFD
uniref:LOB domain-containing protein n=1 Tax=Kalanchoe fedtschenkoi TaxID=63787 RepID=A0A7N0TGB0_KALFE